MNYLCSRMRHDLARGLLYVLCTKAGKEWVMEIYMLFALVMVYVAISW